MSGSIINFYEQIEKEEPGTLIKPPNPNFNLHQMEISFRSILVAPSGTGKTNMLVNIIAAFSAKKGTFASITVITQNKNEPLYKYLEKKGVVVLEGLNKTPDLDKYDETVPHLIVFDDLVLSKDLKVVEKYYIRARKQQVSVMFLSQRYFPIPKMIRTNVNYLFILKVGDLRELRTMISEFALGITSDQIINMYTYATSEKFSAFLIDKEIQDEKKKYRKNLLEYLDPDKFK
jgi:hypothetical protein